MRRIPYSLIIFPLLFLSDKVLAQLYADFSMDRQGGCSPLVVNFTNRTMGASANATYTWDFGNGNVSALANGGAVYTDEKTYTVKLTVQDGSNQSVQTKQVTVYSPPVVDFSVSSVKGCLPFPVTFTSNSSAGNGSISDYVWDFGDGSTQTNYSNISSHTYQVVQKPNISLTVTNSYGCHTTLQKQAVLSVIPTLTASFTADKRVLCLPTDPVQFTNASTGPGTLDYAWDFGDGHSSTALNPSYSFNKKGIYTVTLTVHSSEGCTAISTLTNGLNVASYSTDFSGPTQVCVNTTVSFQSNNMPTPDNSVWQIDGSNAYYNYGNFSTRFSTPGTHTVGLSNFFGACPQSLTKQIIVKDIPHVGGFTQNLLDKCGAPARMSFTDNTAGATAWAWTFTYQGSGTLLSSSSLQAPTITFTDDGFYNANLNVSNADGCSASVTQLVQIFAPWENIYRTAGSSVTCNTPINAGFAVSTGLSPVSSYNWGFSDGTSSTDPAPSHTFTNPGNYTVQLNFTDQNGCRGSSNTLGLVISKPVNQDFSSPATTICPGGAASFIAKPADPNVSYWNWSFGDPGGTSSGATITHVYNNPGTYTVTLTAGNQGCNSTVTKTAYITVRPLAVVLNSPGNTCDGTRGDVTFGFQATAATKLTLDFGDGTRQQLDPSATTTTHTYTRTGSYAAILTASNDQCTVTDGKPVMVLLKQQPLLTASKTVACANNDPVAIQISNLERNPWINSQYTNPYYFQQIEYQDGSSFTGSRIDNWPYFTIPYNGSLVNFKNGSQQLRIILTSAVFGCQDVTNYIPVTVKGATPAFAVTTDNQCYQSPVVLTDQSQNTPDNPIQSWYWDFGDGQSVTNTKGGSVSHTYSQPGTYNAVLTIKDAGGCSTSTPSYSQNVHVQGPLASFYASGTNVPLNTTVYFYNNSNTANSNVTWKWEFGDGNTSTDASPYHTYPIAGTYTVKLTATNTAISCSSAYTQVITVRYFNTAFSFSKSFVSGACPPVMVNFSNTSWNYTRVTWDFGDGFTADNVNYPSHVYQKPGKYTITLYGYAWNGVNGTFTDVVNIPEPTGTLASDHAQACIGDPVNLKATAGNTSSYVWDFGDGSVLTSTDPTDGHVYQTAGIYHPAVLMQDVNGCYNDARLAGTITVRPNPVITIDPASPWICKGGSVPLQASASGGTVYTWTPPDGLSNPAISSPVASPTVTTTYTVKVTDDLGCRNTKDLTLEVIQPADVSVSPWPDTAVCLGDQVHFHATGEEVYQWIGDTQGLSDPGIADPVATPSVTTTYTVRGSDRKYCFPREKSVNVRVMSLPTVNAGQDVVMQVGETTQLHATGSSDVVSWQWTPETYLSCGDCSSPVCDPLISMTYVIKVTNANTCHASDTVHIKLLCEEDRVRVPNAFTPNGDGVNDVFIIKGIAMVKHLVIFSRWGAKVFERNNFIAGDRNACWNGTSNGERCPAGTYVWFAEMECPAGGVFARKGTVILIR